MNNDTHTPAHVTPMLAHYLSIKEQHPHTLLFYRMGDFFELFFEDAVVASRELQITLTSRSKDAQTPVPMCGVPWHSVTGYINQLVHKGFTVVICDQVEDAKAAKGLVKREVVRICTPGTMLEDDHLDAKSHNFLGAVFWNETGQQGGFAWVDISTGQWTGLQARKQQELWQWVQKIAPKELLVPDSLRIPADIHLEATHVMPLTERSHFDKGRATHIILETQGVQELAALDLAHSPELTCACGALLLYVGQTQQRSLAHFHPFTPLQLGHHLLIDEITERNLEIFVRLNGRKGKGTLWHLLDDTMTPMGGRLLQERLRHPWRQKSRIGETQAAVAYFVQHASLRTSLRETLLKVYDMERLSTRIHLNRASPQDFVALYASLVALPHLMCVLQETIHISAVPSALAQVCTHWDNLHDCAQHVSRALVDEPPATITDGGLFKAGYNAELDTLIELVEHGQQKLQAMLEEEKRTTGIAKLKMGYNRVFGYYFELSHANKISALPAHFIRRQTLVNAERFVTPQLKELEDTLLHAADKRKSLEYTLFQELREHMTTFRQRIIFMAELVAHLDYWQCLAAVASKWEWCAPHMDTGVDLYIREGRHPVIESLVGSANFVANDIHLDNKRRLCLLTGPNMAGKSTLLRQTALICLLAHMGSFVPAREARIGIMDRIFSRVGASDNLAQGQSTFMVEMMETARIMRQSTKNSLVILDEIGRGTSTYDGLALAWAIVEDIVMRHEGAIRTLFATHYHEITALEGTVPHVFTMNIAIREIGGEILFLHRLVPGPSDRSYGVEVARIAGIPMPVVKRARELLHNLERSRPLAALHNVHLSLPGVEVPSSTPHAVEEKIRMKHEEIIIPEHPLLQILQEITPENLTPLEALKLMSEWKLLWGVPKVCETTL